VCVWTVSPLGHSIALGARRSGTPGRFHARPYEACGARGVGATVGRPSEAVIRSAFAAAALKVGCSDTGSQSVMVSAAAASAVGVVFGRPRALGHREAWLDADGKEGKGSACRSSARSRHAPTAEVSSGCRPRGPRDDSGRTAAAASVTTAATTPSRSRRRSRSVRSSRIWAGPRSAGRPWWCTAPRRPPRGAARGLHRAVVSACNGDPPAPEPLVAVV
jgi:hypothetical protein